MFVKGPPVLEWAYELPPYKQKATDRNFQCPEFVTLQKFVFNTNLKKHVCHIYLFSLSKTMGQLVWVLWTNETFLCDYWNLCCNCSCSQGDVNIHPPDTCVCWLKLTARHEQKNVRTLYGQHIFQYRDGVKWTYQTSDVIYKNAVDACNDDNA